MSEFLLRLKAAFRVSRGHDHLRAAGDERLCRRETDARSPAGDQRNFSQKILHTSCLLTSCCTASLCSRGWGTTLRARRHRYRVRRLVEQGDQYMPLRPTATIRFQVEP